MSTTRADGVWFASDPVHSARPIDLLTATAVAYLALPVLIFCASWLRLPYAIVGCLLLLGALGVAARPRAPAWRLPYPAATLLLVAVAAFTWAAFGGAGHLFYANTDWVVRDAVLMDLVHTQWPPSYGEYGGDPMILRTAFAYFLPAAALGAVLGAGYADAILYLWTGSGAALFLMLLPLPRRPGARLALAIGVIVMFSGMDIVGVALVAGFLPAPPMHLEWWAHPLQYSSLTTQLFWVPNHALPGWIATALFYRHWREAAFWPLAVLIGALLPLWTPFAALGMAPFIAYLAVDRRRRGAGLWLPPAVWVPAILLLALEMRYLGLGFATLDANTPAEAVFDAGKYVVKYIRFALLEFALLGVALFAVLRDSRGLCAVSFAVLALLPLVSFGPSNDIVMRTSIPSLAMLAVLGLRALDDARTASDVRLPRLLVIVALCLGAVTPAYEFWRAVARPSWPPSLERTLLDVTKGQMPANYVGRLDRADLKAILRPPTLVAPRRSP